MGQCQCTEKPLENAHISILITKKDINGNKIDDVPIESTREYILMSRAHQKTVAKEKDNEMEIDNNNSCSNESKISKTSSVESEEIIQLNCSSTSVIMDQLIVDKDLDTQIHEPASNIQQINNPQLIMNESTHIPASLDDDQEYDHFNISYEIFMLLNEIRTNPVDYSTFHDTKIQNFLKKLSEETSDNILWSQKLYDIAYEYLLPLPNKNIPSEIFNLFINKKLNQLYNSNYSCFTYSFNGNLDAKGTLYGIISENITYIRRILLDNYDFGFVCSIPCSVDQYRAILFLAVKE